MIPAIRAIRNITELNNDNKRLPAFINLNENALSFFKERLSILNDSFYTFSEQIGSDKISFFEENIESTIRNINMISKIIAKFGFNKGIDICVDAIELLEYIDSIWLTDTVLFGKEDLDFYYENEWNKDCKIIDIGYITLNNKLYLIQIVDINFEFASNEDILDYARQGCIENSY